MRYRRKGSLASAFFRVGECMLTYKLHSTIFHPSLVRLRVYSYIHVAFSILTIFTCICCFRIESYSCIIDVTQATLYGRTHIRIGSRALAVRVVLSFSTIHYKYTHCGKVLDLKLMRAFRAVHIPLDLHNSGFHVYDFMLFNRNLLYVSHTHTWAVTVAAFIVVFFLLFSNEMRVSNVSSRKTYCRHHEMPSRRNMKHCVYTR